jgi:small ubiquitin-related modifier
MADTLEITIKDLEGHATTFKIRPTTKLGKVNKAYCEQRGFAPGSIRLMFEGERITDLKTCQDMDIQDGDSIDAVLESELAVLAQLTTVVGGALW